MRAKHRKKRSGWAAVNSGVLVLHIIFPVWLYALMMTSAISGPLAFIAVGCSLGLGVVWKLAKRFQWSQKVIYVAWGVTACAIIAYYVPLALLCGFTKTKALYHLKRWDYATGVFGDNAEYYERLLPEYLPDVCEGYSFRTQGSVPAQDYHPSSFLVFHTDAATVGQYMRYYEGIGLARLDDDEDKRAWTARMLRLSDEEAAGAVVFYLADYYPKAVLLSQETGLVGVLT